MTSRQRSRLRAAAASLQPIAQIGKGGISENVLKSLSDALEARELIKITVLPAAEESARETGDRLAELLKAECVAAIGRRVILYRRSSRPDFEHIGI